METVTSPSVFDSVCVLIQCCVVEGEEGSRRGGLQALRICCYQDKRQDTKVHLLTVWISKQSRETQRSWVEVQMAALLLTNLGYRALLEPIIVSML